MVVRLFGLSGFVTEEITFRRNLADLGEECDGLSVVRKIFELGSSRYQNEGVPR